MAIFISVMQPCVRGSGNGTDAGTTGKSNIAANPANDDNGE